MFISRSMSMLGTQNGSTTLFCLLDMDNWILHNGQTNQWLSTMSSSIFLLFLFGAPAIINQSAVSISWHWICGVCWRCCALPRAITYMWSIRPWNHAWQIPLFTTSGLRTLTTRADIAHVLPCLHIHNDELPETGAKQPHGEHCFKPQTDPMRTLPDQNVPKPNPSSCEIKQAGEWEVQVRCMDTGQVPRAAQ